MPARHNEGKESTSRGVGAQGEPYVLLYGLAILIISLGFLLYLVSADDLRRFTFMEFFGPASLVILIGMTGLSFYAYRFYRDIFYQFLAIGWFSNALYIGLEAFFPRLQADFAHALNIYIFAVVSFVPFHFASYVTAEHKVSHKALLSSVGLMIVWLVGSFYLGTYLAQTLWREWPMDRKFMVYTWGGIFYSAWVLFRVGKALKTRLTPAIHGRWAAIFPASFFAYGALQFLYFVKLKSGLQYLLNVVFLAALLAKILNSISLISVIQRDFANLRRRLSERSWLEDLGALTASIEHDVKNPLQVIDDILSEMRERFQADSEVLAGLTKIEEQRLRIFATTEIIPVLRGEKEYYEQFMEKTSVRDLIARSVQSVKKAENTEGIHFVYPENVVYVTAYRPMLQQAIVNILRNGVEAIREARRDSGVMRVKWDHIGDSDMLIQIADNGCGIPKENLPKLGKLFTTKQQKKPNSGIGLFISERIIGFHRGKLLPIESIEGKGTTVTLILPSWQDAK